MMVLDFLYANSCHFFNIIIVIIIITILIIIIIILFSYCPFIFYWVATVVFYWVVKLPWQLFFSISKQKLINILFHRGAFVKDRK